MITCAMFDQPLTKMYSLVRPFYRTTQTSCRACNHDAGTPNHRSTDDAGTPNHRSTDYTDIPNQCSTDIAGTPNHRSTDAIPYYLET